MHSLKLALGIIWIAFWVYWLASAAGAKASTHRGHRIPLAGLTSISVVLLLRVFGRDSLAVHSTVLGAIGMVVCVSGLALAVWARLILDRNWGMPMTEKEDPELVTAGPYRFVRHPIYTGLLVGILGTALVSSLIGLIIVAVLVGYFYRCAMVEERNLTATFPAAYPAYRAGTKMLIPFVL